MAQLPFLLGVLVTLITGSEALTMTVLEPIRAQGIEVALIFIPDSLIEGEEYRFAARAIQAASKLRIWVVLTSEYSAGSPNFQQLPRAVDDAVDKLKNAGMNSTNYVGVGHGQGGYYLQKYGMTSKQLKAIILMGACLPRTTKLQDYPLPVLTLAAELDGITRITRVAEEYAKLKQELKTSFLALYKTPVILIEGGNHAQFASGKMPRILADKDLIPDVTLSPSLNNPRVLTAKYVNSFLMATFLTSSTAGKDTALSELEEAFLKANKKFQPFLTIKELDEKGDFSRWTVLAQEHFAGKFYDQIQVKNKIGDLMWFFNSKPSIKIANGIVTVETTTLLDYENKVMDLEHVMESPKEINMKLKSKEAIWKAVVKQNNSTHLDGPKVSLKGEPNTCKSLNELALKIALRRSSPVARDRYKNRGRPIIFEEDNVIMFGWLWAPTPLNTWEDADGLHVRAIARVTPESHYCKVITPYRAMEWINIDSFRKFN